METVEKNKVFLIDTLSADINYILQHVQEKNIIRGREYRKLNHKNHTSEEITINLLDTVCAKGAETCEEFVKLLQKTEIQETFPKLKERFSPAHMSHQQDDPAKAADETTEYKMSSKPRGICLIINNIKFKPPLQDRNGTIADEESLNKVFKWLGFDPVVHRDQTAEQMKELLKGYSKKEHNGDCFVCCIMSHGCADGVYGINGGIISSTDLFDPFNGTSCPSLVNKPKAFFIQACRGKKFQLAVKVESDSYSTDNYEIVEVEEETNDEEPLEVDAAAITIPSGADFFEARSTVKGYVSFRKTTGSWFMQSLCKQLETRCPKGTDVPTILVHVNEEVSKMVAGYGVGCFVAQISEQRLTLRKKLVFRVPI